LLSVERPAFFLRHLPRAAGRLCCPESIEDLLALLSHEGDFVAKADEGAEKLISLDTIGTDHGVLEEGRANNR
jgi:hypothetical protein